MMSDTPFTDALNAEMDALEELLVLERIDRFRRWYGTEEQTGVTDAMLRSGDW